MIRAHRQVRSESEFDEEDEQDLKQIKEQEELKNQELKQKTEFIKCDEPEVYSMFEYKPILSGDENDNDDDIDMDNDNDVSFDEPEPIEAPIEEPSSSVDLSITKPPKKSPNRSKSNRSKTPDKKKVSFKEPKSKEKAVAIDKPKKTYKFNKPKKKPTESFLNSNHWRKSLLNEEEAMKQFKARADDPKYPLWPYKCTDCIKGFRKEDIYKRHRILRHNEVIFLKIFLLI